ncbi:GNAT family N-acetyltransferase [Paenibacillus allorhizosphaerae]|uniref:N-acetyltransferase domain-containing protein n=1 Tax=Paenibacillus allorhizosphaerae TaxID=2849866 RepID=A0ABN7TIR2_9BACL|nr:GNAT family N-acetyltransferase [Paenibacillus allorhizosphaerae]CAG7633608.1 hypothetical protein PAECIP111802_01965 [Paenibacillus allorhizosphaerae]
MKSVHVLDPVQIVEYEPCYAQAVADMWNVSQESWGGGNRVRSAESVDRELENAGNLKVFLAIHDDEVVGFCSFSHYKQDEGALYVPLLNVRPDYHGRKVGKALILKAVETTVDMGWPRLDLFTWAGNTKAVPMYKKCGFFWEKKDNSVHLMNFIPTVLQTEALLPYLKRIDWYADSLRSLEIQPDGHSENGFDYFEYAWHKDGTSLRVEFEKTGRGIRLIETNDYSIHTEIDDHDLVFGSSYPVRYVIRNKSGAPLACTIRGQDDKNIRFALEQSVTVQDTTVVMGEFQLDQVLEEQSDWKTHPAVASIWTINGKKAEFRTGIAPKFPAKVKLEVKGQEQYVGVPGEALLTFENNFKELALFEFVLPSSEFIEFGNARVSVRIPAKEKATVPIMYTLRHFGLYSEDVEMTAIPDNGDGTAVTFIRKLHGIFKGNTGRFGGDAVDHWVVVNGPHTISLNKTNNDLWPSHFQGSNQTWWTYPRIGKPYSAEFSKKKAESVNMYQDGDVMVLEAEYRSDDYPAVAFTSIARLSANGIAERYFEIRNGSEEAVQDELHFIEPFHHRSNRLVLPYDGHYYDLEDRYASNFDDWEVERISENWLFSRGEKLSCGFCWDPSVKLVRLEWQFGIEHELGRLAAGQTFRTPSTFLAIGTYTDWWDFRSYAQKRRDPVRPLLKDHFELSVNGGNPFIGLDAKLVVRQHRNQPLGGSITLSFCSEGSETIKETFRQEDAVHSAEFALPHRPTGVIEPVRMRFEADELRFERSMALIPVTEGHVQRQIRRGAAGETYCCSNGPLAFEASPDFGTALHSLVYNGEQWLDSSFPEAGPRSWWNPWHGGISASVQGMSPLSQQEERRSAEFVSLTDSMGNMWSGVALHTHIEKHEKNRGIELSLFALLLPGAPVLCCTTRLTNRSGKVGSDLPSEGLIRYGSDHRRTIVHALNRYPGSNAHAYTNNQLVDYSASQNRPLLSGASAWTAPVFFAFAEVPLTYQELRGLAEIRFDDNNRG